MKLGKDKEDSARLLRRLRSARGDEEISIIDRIDDPVVQVVQEIAPLKSLH
jgi:hypothetical protein